MSTFLASSFSSFFILFAFLLLAGWMIPAVKHYRYQFSSHKSIHQLWQQLLDVEKYPEWKKDLFRVEITQKQKRQATAWCEIPRRGKGVCYTLSSQKKYAELNYQLLCSTIYQGELKISLKKQDQGCLLELEKTIKISNPIFRLMALLKLNIPGELKRLADQLNSELAK